MLLSDCCDDGGVSDGGDSEDGRDGVDDGSDGLLLGSEDGSLLGSDDGESSDEGSLLGVLLGDGSLLGEDGYEEGEDDEPLLLLDFGQQPSPRTITSHLSLSAKCLAIP